MNSTNLSAILDHLRSNWRTTAQSILTTAFAITGYLMVSSVISPHTAGEFVMINGLCKVAIGLLQTDGIQLPSGTSIETTTTSSITTPTVTK